MTWDVLRKYAGINIDGRRKLDAGNVSEYSLSPEAKESLKKRFIIAVEFETESIEAYNQVVLGKMEELESELGIKFYLAGRDYPVHVTILEGMDEQKDPKEDKMNTEKVFDLVDGDERIANVRKQLTGIIVELKYPLLNAGNLLMSAVDIPPKVLQAREDLSEIYSSYGLRPLPIHNILHSTACRMEKFPDDAQTMNMIFRRYMEVVKEIRAITSKSPIQMKVGDVYSGNTHDLLY